MERVRSIFLWLALAFVSTPSLCSNGCHTAFPLRSNSFTLFEENGKVGLKDEQGQVLIPAIYEAIGWSDGGLSIIDKVVGYKLDGLWGLIHTANRTVTSPEYLALKPGEAEFLIAQKNSPPSRRPSFGVVNTAGKVVIPFQYDGLHLGNLRAVVMSRSGTKFHFGLTDLSHNILIPLEYRRIYSLGSLRYAVENFQNKTAIFTDDGTRVTPFSIDSISSFIGDYAIIYQADRQGLINRSGEFILQPTYGEVQLLEDGTIQARKIHNWFFFKGDNTLVGNHEADEIAPLSADHFAVKSGGKLRIAGNDLTFLREEFFSSVSDFRDGIALFRSAGKTGALSTDGTIMIRAQYLDLLPDHDVFRACLDTGYKNRWVVLNASGEEISQKAYEYIGPFNGKYFPVRSRGFWGAVNRAGREIITCVHDSLLVRNGNNVVVKFKGQYGVMDLEENWIVMPQPHRLLLLNDSLYFAFGDSTTYVKSFRGDLVYFSSNPLEYRDGKIEELLPGGARWLLDMNGLVVARSSQPDRTEVFDRHEGLRAIRKDGKFGFIDDEGRLRIANRYDAVKPFGEGRAAIRIRDKWGFIDTREKLVVQPVYDQVENFSGGYAIVRQDGHFGIIDPVGAIVLPLRYDEILRNPYNRFVLRQGGQYGLASSSGALVIHPRYDTLTDTGNGYVVVTRDNVSGVLTLRGVSTIPMVYDQILFDHHRNQYMALKRSPMVKKR